MGRLMITRAMRGSILTRVRAFCTRCLGEVGVPSSEVVHVNESLALLGLIRFDLLVCLYACVREVRAFVPVGKSKVMCDVVNY